MAEPGNAPIPETMEGMRRQNSAYRALIASMQQIQAHQTSRAREYYEAIQTLESERAANALMTERVERLEGALRWLRAFWRPGSGHDTNEVQLALAEADALLAKAAS